MAVPSLDFHSLEARGALETNIFAIRTAARSRLRRWLKRSIRGPMPVKDITVLFSFVWPEDLARSKEVIPRFEEYRSRDRTELRLIIYGRGAAAARRTVDELAKQFDLIVREAIIHVLSKRGVSLPSASGVRAGQGSKLFFQ